jgi:CRISPR-associated endoribonuclease Cas6
VVLKLIPEEDAAISPTQGYHSYSLFLSLIREVAPEMSERIHAMDSPKPFTVSPLRGKFAPGGRKVNSGNSYWLRFTFLDNFLFAQFVHSLIESFNQERRLKLGAAMFRLEEVVTHSQGSPWAGFDSFEDIWERASPDKNVSLDFSSPTAFRSGAKRNVTFPQPELVFGSYLNKWNACSPIKFDDGLKDYLAEHVIPARYKLETRILDFGSYQEVGFEGRCTFLMTDSIPGEIVRQINALANFSFYAGTGAKTTMGMGQTRRINNAGALSHGTRRHSEERG